MKNPLFFLLVLACYFACANKDAMQDAPSKDNEVSVQAVAVNGAADNYTFEVTLKSPDTGCDQYANWWEVFDKEGQLIYRRILGHSHVNEQPFKRSGGPVKIAANQFVYVRGHMNNLGYGSIVFGGTVEDGFAQLELDVKTAKDLESVAPQPGACPF